MPKHHHNSPKMKLPAAIIYTTCILILTRESGCNSLTRIVTTRFGKIQGLVNAMNPDKHLDPIEVFLGVPYATPPTGSNRFSPTRTVSPWDGVRLSTTPGPVCPQKLPDISNETAALERMPRGRLEYLRRLLPLLRNQSEDCLYLNIYAPLQAVPREKMVRHPVIMLVHGESYEWNSGTPYDGSVLASYAHLVVVTLNYRLGILGFLNANIAPNDKARVANYGLMDQVAALHWIQQNILLFGGDPKNVTLLGHSTGAACINFLIISPTVMPGLFHRAVLLSGSALSSWALVEDPVHYAVTLARQVNCSIPEDLFRDHEVIVDCLREVPLSELMKADLSAPSYLSSFGPSVDGVVIKTDFREELLVNYLPEVKRDSVLGASRYDLLFGVVTSEAFNAFSTSDIKAGFGSERRDKIIRTYVRNAYTYHLSEILSTVVNEYTDWERTVVHPINTRDATVAALSDAQYVAPMVLTGDLLSKIPSSAVPKTLGSKSYFYVFDYQTKDGDYPQRMGTIHGEELPYFLGAPITDGFSHFPKNYSKPEVALSESVIHYLSNFAHFGNPNMFPKQDATLPVTKEKNRFRSITWDEYDPVHQKYLEIGMKPRMKNHYRAHQLSVWLRLVPELHKAGMEDVIARHNLFRNHEDKRLYDGIVRSNPLSDRRRQNGTVAEIVLPFTTMETVTTCVTVHANTRAVQNRSERLGDIGTASHAYTTAFNATVAIGCSLLVLNILIFAGVYYQRDKTKLEIKSLRQKKLSFDTVGKSSASVIVDIEREASAIVFGDGSSTNSLTRLHLIKSKMAANVHPNLSSTLPRNTTFKSVDQPPPNGSLLRVQKTPPPKSKNNHNGDQLGNHTLKVPAAAMSEMRV